VAASLGAFELALADLREDGAEVLVLDDGGLRNLPQLVEGGVWQVEPTVADRLIRRLQTVCPPFRDVTLSAI
jgi:hypothetical protein